MYIIKSNYSLWLLTPLALTIFPTLSATILFSPWELTRSDLILVCASRSSIICWWFCWLASWRPVFPPWVVHLTVCGWVESPHRSGVQSTYSQYQQEGQHLPVLGGACPDGCHNISCPTNHHLWSPPGHGMMIASWYTARDCCVCSP